MKKNTHFKNEDLYRVVQTDEWARCVIAYGLTKDKAVSFTETKESEPSDDYTVFDIELDIEE